MNFEIIKRAKLLILEQLCSPVNILRYYMSVKNPHKNVLYTPMFPIYALMNTHNSKLHHTMKVYVLCSCATLNNELLCYLSMLCIHEIFK